MSIYELTLTKKEIICDDVMLFDFENKEGSSIAFKAGQYVNIFLDGFNDSGGHQGRSYTMMPTDSGLSIAVRLMGEFSTALHNLELGTKVTADGPHGTLCPSKTHRSFVCIAAGIGIAPFVGWLEEFEDRVNGGEKLNAQFLISNNFKRRSPFIEKFLSAKKDWMTSSLFFTRENTGQNHRIGIADIEKVVGEMPEADFAVCGSISFTRDMWKMLKQFGVPEERIFTEAFF